MKKLFVLACSVLLPLFASAYSVSVDGISYEIVPKEGVATVISGPCSEEIIIPSSIVYDGKTYSVASIGNSAFQGCTDLTSVTIPSSVKSIGDSAFQGCTGLTSVTIPSGLTSIGNSVFFGCRNLSSITVPSSVTSIGSKAFYGCTGLTSVHISDIEAWCKISFFDSNSNPLRYGRDAYINGKTIENLVIPSGVSSIGNYAFFGSAGLISVSIPSSVKSFGSSVFAGCSSLTSVSIQSGVSSIGDYAFSGCTGLISVSIPSSVTSIGAGAFFDCRNLSSSIEIPSGVTSIGSRVFAGCSSLTSVTIPSSVASIRQGAFEYCSSLTSITIPSGVTSIGSQAFYGCTGLTSVHISDIEAWCKISFNSNPLTCAHHLFLNGEEVKDLIIPGGVTSIGSQAFNGCTGLTSVTLGSATGIGDCAFYGCSGLISVIIPNSVKSIGNEAFAKCSLSTVEFGESIKTISTKAFAYNKDLTNVTCMATATPETSSDAFGGTCIEFGTLHVPAESVDDYNAAIPWSQFMEIVPIAIDPNQKYTLTYLVDGEVYKSYEIKYGSTITPLDEPTKEGYTFSGWSEIPEEMPAHDVTVTGTFIKNLVGTCAAPTISVAGNRLTFGCETEGVTYHYTVSSTFEKSGEGNSVELQNVYKVTVYATKDDYAQSETVTKEVTLDGGSASCDANGDGVVDAADIVTVTNAIMQEGGR